MRGILVCKYTHTHTQAGTQAGTEAVLPSDRGKMGVCGQQGTLSLPRLLSLPPSLTLSLSLSIQCMPPPLNFLRSHDPFWTLRMEQQRWRCPEYLPNLMIFSLCFPQRTCTDSQWWIWTWRETEKAVELVCERFTQECYHSPISFCWCMFHATNHNRHVTRPFMSLVPLTLYNSLHAKMLINYYFRICEKKSGKRKGEVKHWIWVTSEVSHFTAVEPFQQCTCVAVQHWALGKGGVMKESVLSCVTQLKWRLGNTLGGYSV